MNPRLESRIWTEIAVRAFQFLVDEYGFVLDAAWTDPNRRGNGSVRWRLPGKISITVSGDCDDVIYFVLGPVLPEIAVAGSNDASHRPVPVELIAETLTKAKDSAFRWRSDSLRCPWSKRAAEEQFKRWSQLLRVDCERLLRGEPYEWNKLYADLDEAVRRAVETRSWEKIMGFPKLR